MRTECYFCHIKTVESLIAKHKPKTIDAEAFMDDINTLLGPKNNLSNPQLATLIHRKASVKLNIENLYKSEKESANELLLTRYDALKSLVQKSANPLKTAIKLAVAGNIIDYGAHSVGDDIEQQILTLLKKELVIDQSDALIEAISKAKSILYLGDNAGEIVCDKLLIEILNHKNLRFAVRGKPVINDVTREDAKAVGLDKLCKIIDNGYDAPSTLLEHCSVEFQEAFEHADLIIAKGQGNFEGLMNHKNKTIYFLLMAKCVPIAEMLNVNPLDMIVTTLNA